MHPGEGEYEHAEDRERRQLQLDGPGEHQCLPFRRCGGTTGGMTVVPLAARRDR